MSYREAPPFLNWNRICPLFHRYSQTGNNFRIVAMESINAEQMWRKISPEEKFQLLARAHTAGVSSVLLLLFIFLVLSVGLREKYLLWAALCLLPVVFQRASLKRWRELKPRTIIEYLAVRSAARRFAFTFRARDLSVLDILRGFWTLEAQDRPDMNADFPDDVRNSGRPVWLVLLGDCVVCLSEAASGARLEYVGLLREGFDMQSVSVESQGGGKLPVREFRFWGSVASNERISYRFTSRFHGSMMLFEHRLEQQKKLVIEQQNQLD